MWFGKTGLKKKSDLKLGNKGAYVICIWPHLQATPGYYKIFLHLASSRLTVGLYSQVDLTL